MPDAIVIVGCGGHGREIFGIISAINEMNHDTWKILGFVDDAPQEINLRRLERLDTTLLGPLDELAGLEAHYVIGIGDPRIRALVAARLDPLEKPAAELIHPTATVGLDNSLGEGVVLFPGARITTNVTLGRHTHLSQNATVGHDSVLADHAQVNPLAAVSGDCKIGDAALIGTTAAVLQGLTIGARAIVGAGACVVRDVQGGTVVKGVPAR
jgi:sugar O-acyltransferase (sialic acid O-acetyltransferase NeuD family)